MTTTTQHNHSEQQSALPPKPFIADSAVLSKYRSDFNASANVSQQIARNAISHTQLSKVLINPQRADTLHTTFSDELDINTKTSDQRQSGRCWIFSFLNVLRAHTVHRYDLDASFEFSQSYVFFWDQFEKCNLFLHHMWALRDKPTDNEYVREMLKEPISDGGQWHMLQNVVLKYGVVPKQCMEETHQSKSTEKLTQVLCGRLREFARDIRTKPAQNSAQQTIQPMMYEIYCVLCMFLGEPPQTIQWQYNPSEANWAKNEWKKTTRPKRRHPHKERNRQNSVTTKVPSQRHSTDTNTSTKRSRKSSRQHSSSKGSTKASTKMPHHIDKKPFEASKTVSPVEFFHKWVQFPLEDYVTVINYPHPDRPYHRTFTVKYLNNMVSGREAKLYNVPLEALKQITARSIDAGEPVWFCADMGKDMTTKYGFMDPVAFEYQNIFRFDPHGWDKGMRMEYKDGVPNHAMVLRGYHCPGGVGDPNHPNHPKHPTRPPTPTTDSKKEAARKTARKSSRALSRKSSRNSNSFKISPRVFEKWMVENSWGEFSGREGNLVMSDEWFGRHVYEVAVHKKHLQSIWEGDDTQEDIVLEMWDVFGSLFTVR